MAKPVIEGYDEALDKLIELAAVGEEERDSKAIMEGSLAALLDAAHKQKAKAAALKKVADVEKKIYDVLEWFALKKMEDLGTEVKDDNGKVTVVPMLRAGGMFASGTVTETDTPNVEDWDAFYEYMRTEKMMYLVQKRAAVKACQELWEMDIKIPGVEIYTKRSLSLRKAPK